MEMRKNFRQRERNILKGLVAGVIGGLVASFVMNKFQAAWNAVSESMENSSGGGDQNKTDQAAESGEQDQEDEPATTKAAEAISEGIFDHELTKREKKYAEPAVHYAMGGGSAAVYGVAAEFFPQVTVGAGLPFGTAVWLVADEIAVPALGLSKSPFKYPASTHAYALVSHFVYGLSTEIVRRTVRRALD